MALYQFFLAAVPKSGLLKVEGKMLDVIKVCNKTNYFGSDTESYWRAIKSNPNEISSIIDKLVDQANWGNDEFTYRWKTHTDKIDNDAHMKINEDTGNIEHLSFRADLREKGFNFLMSMIDLGNQHKWVFMDRKGNIADADINEIKQLIKISNTYRFLKDPEKFFTDIESGKLKIE